MVCFDCLFQQRVLSCLPSSSVVRIVVRADSDAVLLAARVWQFLLRRCVVVVEPSSEPFGLSLANQPDVIWRGSFRVFNDSCFLPCITLRQTSADSPGLSFPAKSSFSIFTDAPSARSPLVCVGFNLVCCWLRADVPCYMLDGSSCDVYPPSMQGKRWFSVCFVIC
jgi:hypothetical protein